MRIPSVKALKSGFGIFAAVALLVFLASYIAVHHAQSSGHGQVALVRVEGEIFESRHIIKQIQRYQRDPMVRAMVLRVDSPGGGVVASQEIHDAVRAFRDSGKPVVASMGTLAASGGYYVSAPATTIVANPGTITGSIGVIMTTVNVQGLLEKIGVQSVTIKAGLNKDIASPFRPMTDAERALLQAVMDDMHGQFIKAVAEGRGRDVKEIRALADGRIFSGQQALEAGLVDELGNLETAIRKAGSLVGIEGRPAVVEDRPSRIDELLGETKSHLSWVSALFGSMPAGQNSRILYMLSL
ncbi:MAG: signal peptide peptidase SppA [Nitrospirota bacterium]|nr:signal peptide peptidase SppA [Nitrospirota bacterium]